jgi:hypothetical protein
MKLSGLEGSRWDIFQKYFKKVLSWDLFKQSSNLYNSHLNRHSGWTFSKDQTYLMPKPTNDDIRQSYSQNAVDAIQSTTAMHQLSVDNTQSNQPDLQHDSPPLQKGIVNASRLHFRKKPGGEHIKYLDHDTPVDIIQTFDKWLHVSIDGQEGFVFRKYIIPVNANEIITTSQPEDGMVSEIIDENANLPDFNGDLTWIHQWEGHCGKPYWPGGSSGITLDPGVDLGHSDHSALIQQCYQSILNHEQMDEINDIVEKKLKGKNARDYLNVRSSETFKSIRITKLQAQKIFPHLIRPYWQDITNRFKELRDPDVPKSVQTAMLSIAYNRGAYNSHLEVLKPHIENKNWSQLANAIGRMQQNHSLYGIRRRRRSEAKMIFDSYV